MQFILRPLLESESSGKSLSFETDAVVLLPLFMKCLFCFFNEIFNVKVSPRIFLLFHGGREEKKHTTCQK